MADPVYGSRWYLMGAPDAGKTALLVQLADIFARRGIVVGMLAVDEEARDIVTRLVQRGGWQRQHCEERDHQVMDSMQDALGTLHIRFYDNEWTIDAAAEDLAAASKELGARAALFIDSIQTAHSATALKVESVREFVTANVSAVRVMATKHRMIVVATSEMNRGAYRSIEAVERTNDMAAAKESGAVEYSARVLLALRSVKGESEKLSMRVTKNKHGPSDREIFLTIDRRWMKLAECDAPDVAAENSARERARAAAQDRRLEDLKSAIVRELLAARRAPTSRKDLVAMARRAGPVRNEMIEHAISQLLLEGRLEGGRGKPFSVKEIDDERRQLDRDDGRDPPIAVAPINASS